MKYNNVRTGIFHQRPNRFIAMVEIDHVVETCHVKNTGRCRELLIPGAEVYLEESNNVNRKTKYSLIGVKKGERLINMDSQAPNKVVYEWIKNGHLFKDITLIKPETTFGNSRFDLYVEADNKKIYIEVKGVTLEEDGVVRFPDAPTLRGIKHIHELCECINSGYEAYLIFVVQMQDVLYFEPNDKTQEEFRLALQKAQKLGVHLMAMDCLVTTDSLSICNPVPIKL